MKKIIRIGGLLAFVISLSTATHAQQFKDYVQQPEMNLAFDNAVEQYNKAIRYNSRLYNGEEYTYKFYNIKGHQYFGDENFVEGNIKYDGQRYDSVRMMYDIYQQKIILEHYRSNGFMVKMSLINEKVEGFSLGEYNFQKLEPDSLNPNLKAGYYNILIDENIALAVYRSKYVQETMESKRYPESFLLNNRYYIVRDGVFLRVKSKYSLMKALGGQKKQLKKFYKNQNIFFRQDVEKAIYMVCSEYVRLTAQNN